VTKLSHILAWILISLFCLLIPLPSIASEKQQKKPKHQSTEPKKKEPAIDVSMPVYKPPLSVLRGAPVGRVGGGTP